MPHTVKLKAPYGAHKAGEIVEISDAEYVHPGNHNLEFEEVQATAPPPSKVNKEE
jgi:hypothetical protein